MSKTRYPLLYALMIPVLVTLAACAHEAADDAYATPETTDAPSAANSMSAGQTMPPDQTMPPTGDDMGMAADEMSFAEMDANQDGGISMDELSPGQMLHQHFSVADADGNGILSEAEVTQHRADMGMQR